MPAQSNDRVDDLQCRLQALLLRDAYVEPDAEVDDSPCRQISKHKPGGFLS